MSWRISSQAYGGARYGTAPMEDYLAVARALGEAADDLSTLAVSWSSLSLYLRSQQASSTCPVMRGGSAPIGAVHSTLPFESTHRICMDCAERCRRIGEVAGRLADLLIRAHSLYADAETTTRRALDTAAQTSMTLLPLHTSAVMGLWGAVGALTSSRSDGGRSSNVIGALSSTAWAHQGLMNAIARMTDPVEPLLSPPGTVNEAARRLCAFTSGIANRRQGDMLTVRRVRSRTPVVTTVHSVDDALAGLQRLGSQRDGNGTTTSSSGLDYATIAVQRYRKPNGSDAWLVVIPGTDGQPDSPFGWLQNVEAMSEDPNQRRHADSVRLVHEAMRRSGISPTDEVALVGHSQGGIVAAAIASDDRQRFSIGHVVTAGSPIAGHRIPERTWVTSIEIEDELVAQLDGAANPRTASWLTVHGTVLGAERDGIPHAPFASSRVEGIGNAKQISHALPFHQAAYRNIEELGSPAVQRHEQHFQELLEGELIETSYWQGRMSPSDSPVL